MNVRPLHTGVRCFILGNTTSACTSIKRHLFIRLNSSLSVETDSQEQTIPRRRARSSRKSKTVKEYVTLSRRLVSLGGRAAEPLPPWNGGLGISSSSQSKNEPGRSYVAFWLYYSVRVFVTPSIVNTIDNLGDESLSPSSDGQRAKGTRKGRPKRKQTPASLAADDNSDNLGTNGQPADVESKILSISCCRMVIMLNSIFSQPPASTKPTGKGDP